MRRGSVGEMLGRLEYTVGSATMEAISALFDRIIEVLHSVMRRNVPDIETQNRVFLSLADEVRGHNKSQETSRFSDDCGPRKPTAQEVTLGIAIARTAEEGLSAFMNRLPECLSHALDKHVPDSDLRQRILADAAKGLRAIAEDGAWFIRPKSSERYRKMMMQDDN